MGHGAWGMGHGAGAWGQGEAGEAGEEKLLINAQCPMPNAQILYLLVILDTIFSVLLLLEC
ncbi:hypothetical protein HUN01_30925 [Nostoc edaphicum CCNP1411]|uniref:Uncharacterized protein n=1 Tax=Nostoc edaphicum CCNP1411 TaxID=1472755 RepID=A0A7D7QBK7_9NOSO|nr:hypothetical protein [Nostoc edaphicum]QMS91797.1 hypothetical protein HUN01_30925 [Nostoc edaphicum CCNP1411]